MSNKSQSTGLELQKEFKRGYTTCITKNGKDPIPNLLPGTDAYRAFMQGWNKGLVELKLL